MRWDSETQTICQVVVKGKPILHRLSGQGAVDLVARIALTVASIAKSCLMTNLTFDGLAQMNRTYPYLQKLKQRAPLLSSSVEEPFEALSRIHHHFENNSLFPIHGAPHVHQCLDDGQRLGLVDFDRFSLGDRELDVATFLTELEWEGSMNWKFHQFKQTFLSAYESVADPLNPTLLWAYRAHKCLAKASNAAQAVRPHGDERGAHYPQCSFPIPTFEL